MKLTHLVAALASASLTVTPALAAPSARPLSVSQHVRAAAPAKAVSQALETAEIAGIAAAIAIVGGLAWAISSDDSDESDSN